MELKQPFNLKLEVWECDTPDGPPTGPVMCKDWDLMLNNFGTFLALEIVPYNSGAAPLVSGAVNDVSNTVRYISHYVDGLSASDLFLYSNASSAIGTRVGVGVGGGSGPARSDYNLASGAGSWTALSGNAQWTSGTGQVTFAGSVLMSSNLSTNVTEAGMTIDGHDMGGTTRQVMMFHDVFSGVQIASGKYAHVAYTLQL